MECVFVYLCVLTSIHLLEGAALNVQASVFMRVHM